MRQFEFINKAIKTTLGKIGLGITAVSLISLLLITVFSGLDFIDNLPFDLFSIFFIGVIIGNVLMQLGIFIGNSKSKSGDQGERNVAHELNFLKSHGYRVLNSIELDNGLFLKPKNGLPQEIDHLVIGPNGVFHIDTKNYFGELYFDSNDFRRSNGSQEDPRAQTFRHQATLISFFKEFNIPELNNMITGVICFSHPESKLHVEGDQNEVIIVKKGQLCNRILKHSTTHKLEPSQIDKIYTVINTHIETNSQMPQKNAKKSRKKRGVLTSVLITAILLFGIYITVGNPFTDKTVDSTKEAVPGLEVVSHEISQVVSHPTSFNDINVSDGKYLFSIKEIDQIPNGNIVIHLIADNHSDQKVILGWPREISIEDYEGKVYSYQINLFEVPAGSNGLAGSFTLEYPKSVKSIKKISTSIWSMLGNELSKELEDAKLVWIKNDDLGKE